ncbi:MAG: hypothetical protein MRY64_15625 [Hyphomonadaceae bacterium]|nr:hypothetical protein [Hyphomonadaceae bacterium]
MAKETFPSEAQEKPIDFEALHEAYLADPDLQLERPGRRVQEARTPPVATPGWVRAIGRFFDGLFSAIGPALGYVGILVVGALVVWLLWFLFGEALSARFGRTGKERDLVLDSHVEDLRPDAAAARSLLEEADALAAEGRFAEAVHLLLFRSIEDIQTRKEGRLPTSLTAREIGGLSDLPDRARAALSPIIGVVERSFFGGRDVDSGGWQTARSSYEEFAFGGLANG